MTVLACRVEDCDTGTALFNATVTDNAVPQNITASNANGEFIAWNAYVGYRITVSMGGGQYLNTTHVVDDDDIKRETLIICLRLNPDYVAPSSSGSTCPFVTAMESEVEDEHTDGIYATLHRLRVTLLSSSVGNKFVRDYEDEKISKEFVKRLEGDPLLSLEALRLVLTAGPAIRALSGRDVLASGDVVVISDRLVKRTLRFTKALRADGGERFGAALDRFDAFARECQGKTISEVSGLLDTAGSRD